MTEHYEKETLQSVFDVYFNTSTQQERLDNICKDILKFNRIAGNNHLDPNNKTNLRIAYEKFLYSEYRETVDATELKDIVDGICDMWVVGVYYYLLATGNSYKNTIDDAKPFKWYNNFKEEITKDVSNIISGQSNEIESLLLHLEDIIASAKFNMIECLEAVVSSIFSKVPTVKDFCKEHSTDNLEKAIKKEIKRLTDQGEYSKISYRVVKDNGIDYIVFVAEKDLKENVDFESPKIIKPKTFFEPYLEAFLPE